MNLTVYHDDSAFELLHPEWNELLARSASDRVFSTWQWQVTWWRAYRPGKLWIITCRDEAGRLIGIAPWFIEGHPVHGRVVRSIGCVEVTDYLDIIADKESVDAIFHTLAAFVIEHRSEFEVIDLCNLPEDSPTYLFFPDVLRQCGFTVTIKQQEVCPIIVLPDSWDAYLQSLDKKQRHEIRRKLRKAEGEGIVAWYTVGDHHDLHAEIERFLNLMAASQYEKASFLDDPKNRSFFQQVIPLIYDQGWLQLNFLTVNSVATAAYVNLIYNQRVLVYNSGLNVAEHGHLSPGIVLLAYNIRWAIERGYKIFDFLRGNETYKYRMGAQDTRVFMLRAE